MSEKKTVLIKAIEYRVAWSKVPIEAYSGETDPKKISDVELESYRTQPDYMDMLSDDWENGTESIHISVVEDGDDSEMRESLGHALSDYLGGLMCPEDGTVSIDPFNSHQIDALIDVIMTHKEY